MRGRQRTPTTLDAFNLGRVLEVVRLPCGRLGVVDEKKRRVWVEYDLQSTEMGDIGLLPRVVLPRIPETYGEWMNTSVGGVSTTVRRVKIVRAQPRAKLPITVFAVQAPTESAVRDALADSNANIIVGDTEFHADYKYVTEILVNASDDVEHVFARVARAGGVAMLEDASVDARRGLGIERLDRIQSNVVKDDERMMGENDGMYGCRRGMDNWRYPWLPEGWVVPITWDHMVENGLSIPIESLHCLPQPWRQHVAATHLEREHYAPIGSVWEEVKGGVLPEELAFEAAHPDVMPAFPLRRLLRAPPESMRDAIRDGCDFENRIAVPLAEGVPRDLRTLVLVDDAWYRAYDTREALLQHTYRGDKRYVSPSLSKEQSKQLIESLYALDIERVADAEQQHAAALVNFQYMKERGYSARWMGKYEQDAEHIGNSDRFRTFKRLKQYAPHRLPSTVLNRLMGRDGRVHARGSKGSRSKFKKEGRSYYEPGRRMKRTKLDETRMVARESVSASGGE